MRLFYLILISTLFLACDAFEPFEEIPSLPEIDVLDLSLELLIDDINNPLFIDDSGNNRQVNVLDAKIVTNSISNSGAFISGQGEGEIKIEHLPLGTWEEITYSCWMRSYSGNFSELLYLGERGAGLVENRITITNDKIQFGKTSEDLVKFELNDTLLTGEWNMLTISGKRINQSTLANYSVYVNGEIIERNLNSEIKFPPKDSTVILAKKFYGDLDKIRIYSRSLDDDEIKELYVRDSSDFFKTTYEFSVPKGLLAYFTFDDLSSIEIKESFDMISHDVTFTTDTPTTNRNEGSASFNGISSYISSSDLDLQQLNAFSISFWCKTENLIFQPIIYQGALTNGGNGLIFYNNFVHFGSVDFYFSKSFPKIFDGNWHMVTYTCQRINQGSTDSSLWLYIDGEAIESIDSCDLDFDAEYDFLIGKTRYDDYFKGKLDNIRIYNRLLTPKEVNDIYREESF